MRKNFKLLGALAVAGLVAAGGSAFTDANTGINDAIGGYSSADVSGVVVTKVEYVVDVANSAKFSSINFSESTDVVTVTHTAKLTVTGGATPVVTTCTIGATAGTTAAPATITCPTTANVEDVTSIALTVAQTPA